MRPRPLFTVRAVAVVIGHDLRFDLGLDVGEQLFHLLLIDISQLLLDHEPRDWIQIVTEHLHAEA